MRLPPGSLLDSGGLDDLVQELLARLEAEAGPVAASTAGSPAAEETEYPLSDGQKALWLFHRLAPQSAAYNIAGAARVRGELRPGALRRALAAL